MWRSTRHGLQSARRCFSSSAASVCAVCRIRTAPGLRPNHCANSPPGSAASGLRGPEPRDRLSGISTTRRPRFLAALAVIVTCFSSKSICAHESRASSSGRIAQNVAELNMYQLTFLEAAGRREQSLHLVVAQDADLPRIHALLVNQGCLILWRVSMLYAPAQEIVETIANVVLRARRPVAASIKLSKSPFVNSWTSLRPKLSVSRARS